LGAPGLLQRLVRRRGAARQLLEFSWRAASTADFALSQSCPVIPTLTSIIAPNTKAFSANLSFVGLALGMFALLGAPLLPAPAPPT
jgi:hypothetical protein